MFARMNPIVFALLVLATQFVNAWLTEQILTWHEAYTHADALAVGAYFGNDFGDPATANAVAALTVNQLLDQMAVEIDGKHRGFIRAQARLARQYGLDLIAYEGGQHLAGYGGANSVLVSTNSTLTLNTAGIGAGGIGPYPNIHQGQFDQLGRLVIATGGGIYRANSLSPVS